MLEAWSGVGLQFIGVANLMILLVANLRPDLLTRKSPRRDLTHRAPIDVRGLD